MGNTSSTDARSDLDNDLQPYQGHGPDGQRERNILAQSLSARPLIPCLYAQHGCPIKSDGIRAGEHEKDCEFNPNLLKLCHYLGYKCDFVSDLACSKKTVEHLIENHDAVLQTGGTVSLHFQDLKDLVAKCLEEADDGSFGRWKPVILQKSDACKFLLLAKVVYKNNLKMFTLRCVQLNGEVANIKYEAEYLVMSSRVKVSSKRWKEPTQYFSDVKRLQTGIFLDLDDLEDFYTDKKGTMIVKVGILRRGMEASFTPAASPRKQNATKEVLLCDLIKLQP